MKDKKYVKLSKEDTALHRKDFNNKRSKLKIEWEVQTGQKWPTHEALNNKTEKLEIKDYEAHHIIENKYGGPNKWWNLQPLRGGKSNVNQHQSGIHKSKSSKKLFPNE